MSDAPVKIDEVAQIVLNGPTIPTLVLRYRTEKKADKAFKELKSLWFGGHGVVHVEADMFSSLVDLNTISNISLVVHRVRAKFSPMRD